MHIHPSEHSAAAFTELRLLWWWSSMGGGRRDVCLCYPRPQFPECGCLLQLAFSMARGIMQHGATWPLPIINLNYYYFLQPARNSKQEQEGKLRLRNQNPKLTVRLEATVHARGIIQMHRTSNYRPCSHWHPHFCSCSCSCAAFDWQLHAAFVHCHSCYDCHSHCLFSPPACLSAPLPLPCCAPLLARLPLPLLSLLQTRPSPQGYCNSPRLLQGPRKISAAGACKC